MRCDFGVPTGRILHGALAALVVAVACAGTLSAAQADEHAERGVHGHQSREPAFHGSEHGEHPFREHEFREHEFHDNRYLDRRFHHDHYYPPSGFVFGALPRGYFSLRFHGDHLYFGSGIWYRAYAPGRFVVIAPPVGIVVPALPPFYTTVWVDGVPYYYANNVYYVQTPQGYAVAPPPAPDSVAMQPPVPYVEQPAPVPPPPPPATGKRAASENQLVFAYPQHDQSVEQQAKDRYECNGWAVDQAGYDPGKPPPGGGTAAQTDDYRRAMSACLEARGYTVK